MAQIHVYLPNKIKDGATKLLKRDGKTITSDIRARYFKLAEKNRKLKRLRQAKSSDPFNFSGWNHQNYVKSTHDSRLNTDQGDPVGKERTR